MALEIRLATGNDASDIAEIYRPYVETTPISFEIKPPDAHEIMKRMEAVLPDYPWLVCEQEGRVVGYAYGSRHSARAAYQWSVDTSVYVHTGFQRRGIGRGLYVSLFRILRAQGYFNAYAGITLPNAGSVGLHEAAGFQAVGVYRNVGYKMGVWHDVGWWQVALQPLAAEPRPPISVARTQEDPSWRGMLAAGLECIRDSR